MTRPTDDTRIERHAVDAPRVSPGRPIAAALALVAVIVLASVLGGCAASPPPVAESPFPAEFAQPEGALKPPRIISGNRRRDAVAYDDTMGELSDSDWAALERLGPRPVWEQLEARRRRTMATQADGPRPTARPDRPATSTLSGLKPHAVVHGPAVPSTQPSTQPATTQPTTAPTTQAADAAVAGADPDESTLPMEVTELPGGRLRIIWVLRSYGGSGVKTSRDPGTSRRTVEVSAPDLAPLVSVVTPALGPGGTITPMPKENTLVITCDRSARGNVVDLLARLDVPQRQVEITAKIFEVSHDFDFQQGSDLILGRLAEDGGQQLASTFSAKRFLDAASAPAGTAAPVQGSVLKLMQTFSDAGLSVDATFQLLAEAGLIRVVSAPRITVAVGQTGYMLAGQELPIQSANVINGALQMATSYKPVGVQLYITPQAAGTSRIKLHTISIVSAVSGFAPLPTMDGNRVPRLLVNPVIDSREAETAVTIQDGDTLVLSGLRMIRTTTRENKIPGLGDLPIISPLFKNHRSQQQMTDLYFFLTPTILDGPELAPDVIRNGPALAHIPAE